MLPWSLRKISLCRVTSWLSDEYDKLENIQFPPAGSITDLIELFFRTFRIAHIQIDSWFVLETAELPVCSWSFLASPDQKSKETFSPLFFRVHTQELYVLPTAAIFQNTVQHTPVFRIPVFSSRNDPTRVVSSRTVHSGAYSIPSVWEWLYFEEWNLLSRFLLHQFRGNTMSSFHPRTDYLGGYIMVLPTRPTLPCGLQLCRNSPCDSVQAAVRVEAHASWQRPRPCQYNAFTHSCSLGGHVSPTCKPDP